MLQFNNQAHEALYNEALAELDGNADLFEEIYRDVTETACLYLHFAKSVSMPNAAIARSDGLLHALYIFARHCNVNEETKADIQAMILCAE